MKRGLALFVTVVTAGTLLRASGPPAPNPITAAVELFHYGVWFPLGPDASPLPDVWMYGLIALVTSLIALVMLWLRFGSVSMDTAVAKGYRRPRRDL